MTLPGTVVEAVELHRVALPLVRPFRASHGVTTRRDVLLVRVRTPTGDGWGECAAEAAPTYTAEYTDGAAHVLRTHLGPRLLAARAPLDAAGGDVARLLGVVRGHPMARAALDTAVLDAQLRAAGCSLAEHLGATAPDVPAGVAVGILDDVGALVDLVSSYVDAGYRRVKLKIGPSWDRAPLAAVRARFGTALELAADANGAYGPYGAEALAALQPLDELELQLLEQPLDPDDLVGHARLATRVTTPLCLDESITSLGTARAATALGAMAAISVKAARLGGYGPGRALHDDAVEQGVALTCGGLLETAIGRAASVAFAALPGFTLTGDLSASDRYYAHDVGAPILLQPGGRLLVPTGAGIGVHVDPAAFPGGATVERVPATS